MIFKALDPDMPDDEVEQIISEVDEDGSGTVDYEGSSRQFSSHSISFLFFSLNRILQINDWLNKTQFHRQYFIFFLFLLVRCITLSCSFSFFFLLIF